MKEEKKLFLPHHSSLPTGSLSTGLVSPFRPDLLALFVRNIQESNKYKVSLTATVLRYASLGPEPLYVICSRPTEIKWEYPGRGFPFHKLRLSAYGGIAEGSQAGDFHYQAIREFTRPFQAPASLWFASSRETELLRVFNEHCYNYFSNEEVISVIWEVPDKETEK